MRVLTIILSVVLLIGCGSQSAKDGAAGTAAVSEKEESHTVSVSFPEYGVFIHHWPDHLTFADHGNVCGQGAVPNTFMILAGRAIIGVISIESDAHARPPDADKTAPFVLKSQEKMFNNNLDLIFEPYGDPSLRVTFNNLIPSYEQLLIDNLSREVPAKDIRVQEVFAERLPLVLPSKSQDIEIMLSIAQKTNATDTTSAFEFMLRNSRSMIGGVCEIDKEVKGTLKTSLNHRAKPFAPGDTLVIWNTSGSKQWRLISTQELLVLKDVKKNKVVWQIPVPKQYDWTFTCSER